MTSPFDFAQDDTPINHGNSLHRFADKLQIKAAKQQRIIRRHSVPSVSLGDEVFSPNFTEVTESRRKNL